MTEPEMVYKIIIKHMIGSQGMPPSVREIMLAGNLPSSSQVLDALVALEKQQKIKRTPNAARTIRVMGAQWIPPESYQSETVD